MILLVDNYDSFVYNLRRYLLRLGQEIIVVRNDQLNLDDPAMVQFEAMVISPGPQSPDQAGVCLELIRKFHDRVPMLGVCLGHQAIWQALGGRIVRAKMPIHGRASSIHFKSSALFAGIGSPFLAARYHSLVADPCSQPAGLQITAWSEDQEIMAFEHERLPLFGVQFHPESILTSCGYQLLQNFLETAKASQKLGVLPTSDLVEPLLAEQYNVASDKGSDAFAVIPGSHWQ